MQQNRKTLTLRPIEPANDLADADDLTVIGKAIARGLCITAVYNRTEMKLAPHILYTRHDDPFLDAVVIERAGTVPREVKLSTFKLAGLTEIGLTTQRSATRLPLDPHDPKYAGKALVALGMPSV